MPTLLARELLLFMSRASRMPLVAAVLVLALAVPSRAAAAAAHGDTGPAAASGADSTGPAPADSSEKAVRAPVSSGFWIPLGQDAALWRPDRLQHLTLSATLVLGAHAAGAGDGGSAAPVLALGLGKELLDAGGPGRASRVDLVFDVLGVAAGLLLARLTR